MTEANAGSEMVLVVDDDEGVRETLREVVEMAGCSVALASNGAEALTMLRANRPCLIVLDLMMPVMSGPELLEAMGKEPELAAIPVVISTSAPHKAPRGFPVLSKPISIDALWDWIKKTCHCDNEASAP